MKKNSAHLNVIGNLKKLKVAIKKLFVLIVDQAKFLSMGYVRYQRKFAVSVINCAGKN